MIPTSSVILVFVNWGRDIKMMRQTYNLEVQMCKDGGKKMQLLFKINEKNNHRHPVCF